MQQTIEANYFSNDINNITLTTKSYNQNLYTNL